MRELRLFIQFIEKDSPFKLILALIVYAIVPFAEVLFFIYLGNLIGQWLVLAILVPLVGLPGVLIAQSQLQDVMRRLKMKIRDRQYPGREFVDLLGILVGGIFLVTPGFLTDVLGYLMLVPFLRDVMARALARKMHKGMRDFYDYLRLRELEGQ